MKNILIISALALLIFLTTLSKVSDEEILIAREAVKNGAIIVDVRTPEEFRERHVKNAINIPLEKIVQGKFTLPKEKEIVVYCRSGSRSSTSARALTQKGWRVYDVATQSDWEREIETKEKK